MAVNSTEILSQGESICIAVNSTEIPCHRANVICIAVNSVIRKFS